jgi:hypothetical protein
VLNEGAPTEADTLGYPPKLTSLADSSLKCLSSKFNDRWRDPGRLHPTACHNEPRLFNRFCVRKHKHGAGLGDDYFITIKIDPEMTAIDLRAESIN